MIFVLVICNLVYLFWKAFCRVSRFMFECHHWISSITKIHEKERAIPTNIVLKDSNLLTERRNFEKSYFGLFRLLKLKELLIISKAAFSVWKVHLKKLLPVYVRTGFFFWFIINGKYLAFPQPPWLILCGHSELKLASWDVLCISKSFSPFTRSVILTLQELALLVGVMVRSETNYDDDHSSPSTERSTRLAKLIRSSELKTTTL